MLGIPADMEVEEAGTPEKEPKLLLKPQKTLITNFFKQKDCPKKPTNTPTDLFGYFKKSNISEEPDTTHKVGCKNGLDDSLSDFQDPPHKPTPVIQKPKEEKHKSLKKKRLPKFNEDGDMDHERFEASRTMSPSREEPIDAGRDTEVIEISYADFLKSALKVTGNVDKSAKKRNVNKSAKKRNAMKISQKDFLMSNYLDVEPKPKEDPVMLLEDDVSPMETSTSEEASSPIVDIAMVPEAVEISDYVGTLDSLTHDADPTINDCKESLNIQSGTSVSPQLQHKHNSEIELSQYNAQDCETKANNESHNEMSGVVEVEEGISKDKSVIETVSAESVVENKVLAEKKTKKNVEMIEKGEVEESSCKPAEDKPKMKAKGNIASFFTKIDPKNVRKTKKEDSTVITTEALVHSAPAETAMAQSVKSNLAGKQSPDWKSNVAVDGKDVDLSVITQLESIIIEIPEKKKRVRVSSSPKSDTPENDEGSSKGEILQEEVEPDLIMSEPQAVMEVDDESAESDKDVMEVSQEEQASIEEMVRKRQETKRRNAACIASLDNVDLVASHGKRKQATLSFSAKGLVMGKPLPPEPPNEVELKANSEMANERTELKERKSRTTEKKSVASDDEVSLSEGAKSDLINLEDSPVLIKRKKHKKPVTSTPIVEPEVNKSRKATAKKPKARLFETSIICSPPGQKRVIVKFKRLKSSSGDEFASPEAQANKQVAHCAQKLIMKAISKKPKTSKVTVAQWKSSAKKPVKSLTVKKPRQKPIKTFTKSDRKSTKSAVPIEVADSIPLRRSSRSCAQAAMVAISESFEDKPSTLKAVSEEGVGETTKRGKKASTKDPKGKTQKNATDKKAKIAPIFCGKKESRAAMAPIVVSDEEPEEDPEVIRIRKQFLMSGVPTTLRKQQLIGCTGAMDSDYPLFPKESHIRQVQAVTDEAAIDPWNLHKVSLNLRAETPNVPVIAKSWDTGSLIEKKLMEKPTVCEQSNDPAVVPLTEAVVPYLLAEVSRFNPAYPVRRVFKQLQKANSELTTAMSKLESTADAKKGELEDLAKDTKPSIGKKRKNPEPEATLEVPTQQSKRRRGSGDCTASRMSVRRSRRIQPVEAEVEVVDVDEWKGDKPEPTTPDAGTKSKDEQTDHMPHTCLLWTEKYEPNTGSELLGNSGCVKKLKTWLIEWKQRTDLELRRARKQILKQAKRAGKSREEIKKKLGADWWADDDDFELDDDDSDSEFEEAETCLCNSKLLTGPHGVGKTTAVYSLAKELGYKVFEVNASSQRSGRQMLAQLQEATQSHQVSQKNLDAMFTTSMAAQAIVEKVPVKQETKTATGFANLFGKAKPKTESKPRCTKKQKETKVKKDAQKKSAVNQPTNSDSKRGLDLSSTSLVLFEEVDVIFEEDKGFWAAIQTFMNTTKRPIILTSSDDGVSRLVEARHEIVAMRTPPLVNVTTHLQLVCLAENLRTSFNDVHTLVEFHRGDLRRCFHQLQFWAHSNTDSVTTTTDAPIMYHPDFFESHSTSFRQSAVEGALLNPEPLQKSSVMQNDSSSDFEMAPKVKRHRLARNVIQDESSMDSVKDSQSCSQGAYMVLTEDSQQSHTERSVEVVESSSELVATPDALTAPLLHRACLEAPGLSRAAPGGILPFLQGSVATPCGGDASILKHYEEHGFNLLYTNLASLLGLPCCAPTRRPSAAVLSTKNKTRLRIKSVAELSSSDEETDPHEFVSLKKMATRTDAEDVTSDEPLNSHVAVKKEMASAEDHILMASIRSLSAMYDAFSFADAYMNIDNELREGRCNTSQHSWCMGKVLPGLGDQGPCYIKADHVDRSVIAEAACATKMTGVARCRMQLAKCVGKMEKLDANSYEVVKERLSLPQEGTDLRLAAEFSIYQNLEARHQRSYQYVCSVLPPHVQLEKRAVASDYIPALQNICRSEQLRKITNPKRRFLHYMDSIALPVTHKPHVMDTLCSSFV